MAVDPELTIKHYSSMERIAARHVQGVQRPPGTLRDWQERALSLLDRQDDRRILFVVDREGGAGKSFLAKWIISQPNAWGCQGGSLRDLMHSYDHTATIAVFDMARCNNPDWFPWAFMENLKNGWYCSTKYQGGLKAFVPPKIIVLMNEDPPRNKLSKDRYEILKINEFIM